MVQANTWLQYAMDNPGGSQFVSLGTGFPALDSRHEQLALCRTDFQKIVSKIMALDYKIPEKLQLSDSVKDLLGRIFVKDPESRITIADIKKHEWYLHRLPFELCEGYQGFERCEGALTSQELDLIRCFMVVHGDISVS